MGEIGAGLSVALAIFGMVLLVAWIILPFALIGTKPLLRELIKEQQATNELLRTRAIDRDINKVVAAAVPRKEWA